MDISRSLEGTLITASTTIQVLKALLFFIIRTHRFFFINDNVRCRNICTYMVCNFKMALDQLDLIVS